MENPAEIHFGLHAKMRHEQDPLRVHDAQRGKKRIPEKDGIQGPQLCSLFSSRWELQKSRLDRPKYQFLWF